MATKVAAKTAVKAAVKTPRVAKVAKAVLTISSKNYGAWALRGWLMAKLAGLEFTEKIIPPDDPAMKAEMLLLAPSMLVPSLQHNGIKVWDSLAIGEYLHETHPKAGLLPADIKARAHCRAICGEMHSGFSAMRGALPMNIKAHHPGFKVWSRAQADIDRVVAIWHECFASYGGPFLFGKQPCIADAMYAPVVTRFLTYDVPLDKACVAYCERIMALPAMKEWVAAAKKEPDEIDELDAEF
jgi:glutathione S-transferase